MRRPLLTALGLLAAAALAVKGLLEPPGWPFFLPAAALLIALYLRQTRFRD
jgi:hypothetical protein